MGRRRVTFWTCCREIVPILLGVGAGCGHRGLIHPNAARRSRGGEMTMSGVSESYASFDSASADVPIFTFVLVKLASRCNIDCTYCYWFRDAEVYKKPPVLTVEAEDAFCQKLEEHIRSFELEYFIVVFHGGEPLLFPKRRFITLQDKLRAIEKRTGCVIQRGVTTMRS